ncbi:MAG: hypothetical protein JXA30_06115, partial [Deltaproteobacteria bacterium]|nr:hypothetical protein [Deltaproteobacteria bacterium]
MRPIIKLTKTIQNMIRENDQRRISGVLLSYFLSLPSVILCFVLFAPRAIYAQEFVTNGSFETGDLTGWTSDGDGELPCWENWVVNDSGSVLCGTAASPPEVGTFSAYTSASASGGDCGFMGCMLYSQLQQTIAIPTGPTPVSFSWYDYIDLSSSNEYTRLYVEFDLWTSGWSHIGNVYDQSYSMPVIQDWTFHSVDVSSLLSGYAGQNVILTISYFFRDYSYESTEAYFSAGLDAVSLNMGAVCGNGSLETGEDCDDGNTEPGDCCSATCQYEANGSSCDDENACTQTDQCSGGACVGSNPLTCNDNNGCTDDSCDPDSGCVYTNNTATCGDDGNLCTDDVCSEGACTHPNNTVTCNDNNACTVTDQCSEGV